VTRMSQSQANEAYISVRIVTMDSYPGEPLESLDPFTSDRGYEIRRVPVIRVFGPTPAGQNVCLHIHGIFPYLYIPMPEKEDDGFPYRLSQAIDKSINTSFNMSKSTTQHVYKAIKVSGRPFYGYHPRQHNFIKLYFYNYYMLKRASEMLANGGLMNQVLQPHESHVPFELQFMMDYNLQGMNLIHLRHAVFRQEGVKDEYDEIEPFDDLKPPSYGYKKKQEQSQCKDEQSTTPNNSFLLGTPGSGNRSHAPDHATERFFFLDDVPEYLRLPADIKKVSTCELEIDAVAADILNSNDLAGEGAMNPGLKALWEDERERRRQLGIKDPLTPPDSPPRSPAALESSESEKFWMARYDSMLKEKKEREGTRSLSPSQDPDATINIQHHIGASAYATESSDREISQLPTATQLESHVDTLSASILELSLSTTASPYSNSSFLSQSQIGTPRRKSGEADTDSQDSDDSDNGYGNETVIELDDSDEDFVDMLVNLADDKDTESPNQNSSATENENLVNEGESNSPEETLPPSQSSSTIFNPLSPLDISPSQSPESSQSSGDSSQERRNKRTPSGDSDSHPFSPTASQKLPGSNHLSPSGSQRLSASHPFSPSGSHPFSPSGSQCLSNNSQGGSQKKIIGEDFLNNSLGLADMADCSFGNQDDEFTGPDALSDEELVTLEMTQPIWDSDPWQQDKEEDKDSSSHSEEEKAGNEDIFDMSVWNPDGESHHTNEDNSDSNNQIETNEIQDESILNSSIWSNDNDEELIKTLEMEESKIE